VGSSAFAYFGSGRSSGIVGGFGKDEASLDAGSESGGRGAAELEDPFDAFGAFFFGGIMSSGNWLMTRGGSAADINTILTLESNDVAYQAMLLM
jgi:hypothetical protein